MHQHMTFSPTPCPIPLSALYKLLHTSTLTHFSVASAPAIHIKVRTQVAEKT